MLLYHDICFTVKEKLESNFQSRSLVSSNGKLARFRTKLVSEVEGSGIEPLTYCLQSNRSPS